MTQLPPFSYFSATSELLVTAAVFYVLWRAYYRNEFKGVLLATTLAFEALFNITYMALRIASPAPELHVSPWMEGLLAAHGILSLLMFAGLIAVAVEAFRLHRQGRNLLRERPGTTMTFVVLWSISIVSGEAIFLVNLLR